MSDLSWQQKDTLRTMTEKFNSAMQLLSELEEMSKTVTPGVQEEIDKLSGTLEEKIATVTESITEAVSGVTAQSLGLGYVDNTHDADKPVSAAQKEAIDAVAAKMITSEESEYEGVDAGSDPAISDPIKEYINQAIKVALKDLAAEENVISYGVADNLNLGVVRSSISSGNVYVNPTTGIMSVNGLEDALEAVDTMVTQVNQVVAVASYNKSRITQLAKMKEGSTTGDAELIDGRTDYWGTTYDSMGDAIRMATQLLVKADNEIKNTYKVLTDELKKQVQQEVSGRVSADSKLTESIASVKETAEAAASNFRGLSEQLGNITELVGESDTGLSGIVGALSDKVIVMRQDINLIKSYLNLQKED